jgi:hypothetical protein
MKKFDFGSYYFNINPNTREDRMELYEFSQKRLNVQELVRNKKRRSYSDVQIYEIR